MTPKRTYINLINDFWDMYSKESIKTSAAMVFFYLLHRINRNRWQPVFISDKELADEVGVSRFRLAEYKALLKEKNLIEIESGGRGKNAGTIYGIPKEKKPESSEENVPNGSFNCPDGDILKEDSNCPNGDILGGGSNCPDGDILKPQYVPNGSFNCPDGDILEPPTPIILDIEDNIRHNTSSEDSACAHVKEAGGDVEKNEVLEEEKSDPIREATEQFREQKRKAAAEGVEVLRAFFDPTNIEYIQVLCMQNRLTPDQLRAVAERVIADWVLEGKTHTNKWDGVFNIGDALRHLRMTIPKKVAAEARGQYVPKTREQTRQELVNASMLHLRNTLERDSQTGPDLHEDNPF